MGINQQNVLNLEEDIQSDPLHGNYIVREKEKGTVRRYSENYKMKNICEFQMFKGADILFLKYYYIRQCIKWSGINPAFKHRYKDQWVRDSKSYFS